MDKLEDGRLRKREVELKVGTELSVVIHRGVGEYEAL